MSSFESFHHQRAETEKAKEGITPKSPEVEVMETGEEQRETNSSSELMDSRKTKLGFQREDVSGMIQRMRGKENIRYTNPKGEEFFTKYANLQEGGRDNIEGLKKEKQVLDLLADTGVTPRAGELKIYPSEQRARLIIEHVPGTSLDKMDEHQRAEFLRKEAEKTIHSTSEALDKIHNKGILLVDVNEGTFLLEKKGEGVLTRLVDFELALDLNNNSNKDRETAFRWYSEKDIGLRLDQQISHQSPDVLKKAEINLWARTLAEGMIGIKDISMSITLPTEKQEKFDTMKTKISPILKTQIVERAKKDYEYQSRIPKEERFYELPTEDDFVQKELENGLPRRIEEELLGISLEEKLKAKDIIVSKETVDFISRALNPELQNRPSDFGELKKGEGL